MNEDFPPVRPEDVPVGDSGMPDGQSAGEPIVVHTEPQPDEAQEVSAVPDAAINDIHKAETIAYATKDFRGKAADNRVIAQKQDEGHDMATGIGDISREEPSHLRPLKHKEHQKRLRAAQEAYWGFQEDNTKADLAADAQAIEDIPELRDIPDLEAELGVSPEFASIFSGPPHWSPEVRAEAYDKRADRVEKWAGLLHDHPLSSEFKKAHPGVQFQPKALVRTEDVAEALEQEINHNRAIYPGALGQAVGSMLGGNRGDRWVTSQMKELNRLLHWAGKEEVEEYEVLVRNLRDDAEKIAQFQQRLFDQQKTEPLRDLLVTTRNLLNDVRREVGLPVEGDESEAENQDQPPAEKLEAEPQDQTQGE